MEATRYLTSGPGAVADDGGPDSKQARFSISSLLTGGAVETSDAGAVSLSLPLSLRLPFSTALPVSLVNCTPFGSVPVAVAGSGSGAGGAVVVNLNLARTSTASPALGVDERDQRERLAQPLALACNSPPTTHASSSVYLGVASGPGTSRSAGLGSGSDASTVSTNNNNSAPRWPSPTSAPHLNSATGPISGTGPVPPSGSPHHQQQQQQQHQQQEQVLALARALCATHPALLSALSAAAASATGGPAVPVEPPMPLHPINMHFPLFPSSTPDTRMQPLLIHAH